MVNGKSWRSRLRDLPFTIYHSRPLLDDAALGRLDEADEFLDLGRALNLLANLGERLRGVEPGREQEAEGVVQRVDGLLRVVAALHADGVEAVAAGVVADGEGEGERVLDDDRVAADVRLAPDAAELVDARVGADVRAVGDFDVAGERGGVSHDDAVADAAVVRDVRLGHDEAVVADGGEHPAALRAAVDGDELAYLAATADARLRRLAPVLQVLRREADGDEGEDVRVVADLGAPLDDAVRVEPHALAEPHLFADDRVRADHTAAPDLGARADDGGGMNRY